MGMKTYSLAAALLLACAAAASAEPAWFDAAVKGWDSEALTPVDDWIMVTFQDEDDVPRTLFARTAEAGPYKSGSHSGPGERDAALFAFPQGAPDLKTVVIKSGGETETLEVLTFGARGGEKNLVSPYYIASVGKLDHFSSNKPMGAVRAVIGRRDRPETRLTAEFEPDWQHFPPAFGTDYGEHDTRGKRAKLARARRVVAAKPKGLSTAAEGPLTSAPTDRCDRELSLLTGPEPATWAGYCRQAMTPAEAEFDFDLDGFRAKLWFTHVSPWVVEAGKEKSYKKVNEQLPSFRAHMENAVLAMVEGGAKGPADRFTPKESQFLLCRMASAGKAAEFKGLALQAAGKGAERFVADWRGFIADEAARLIEEGKSAPALPAIPDHAALHAAQSQRAADALAGTFPAKAQAAVQAKAEEKEEKKEARRRRVQATIESMEDVLGR